MDDALIFFGDAVKALGDGKVGGHLIRFGGPADTDIDGEFFTADTDFGAANEVGVYYHHGLDNKIGARRIGRTSLTRDDVGVWVEAQLDLRDQYEQEIYKMAEAGKLGWSSGAVSHLVRREPAGKTTRIAVWPIGEASLTPTPAEFRNAALPIKALMGTASKLTEGIAEADDAKTISDQGQDRVNQAKRLQLRAKALNHLLRGQHD